MKLSELKQFIDRVLVETDEDPEVEMSLDVSTGEEDFDHRLYGNVLEAWLNNNGIVTIAAELTEDNYA